MNCTNCNHYNHGKKVHQDIDEVGYFMTCSNCGASFDVPFSNGWRYINHDTGVVYDFYAHNPLRFIKKHIKTYRDHKNDFTNTTLEVL